MEELPLGIQPDHVEVHGAISTSISLAVTKVIDQHGS